MAGADYLTDKDEFFDDYFWTDVIAEGYCNPLDCFNPSIYNLMRAQEELNEIQATIAFDFTEPDFIMAKKFKNRRFYPSSVKFNFWTP